MKLAWPKGRAAVVAAAAGAVVVALPVVFPIEAHLPWDAVPGFYAAFGALGAAAIAAVSKLLGRVLQRPEGWYGDDAGAEDGPAR